jgi:uncharacterized protein YigA (DUF484 family)
MIIDDKSEKLSAHEVAVWLRRHPNFLGQFPDLAASLVVPRDDGKTASLSSYQLEILRDKNRELNHRLHELSVNAQENEKLSQHIHELSLALIRANTPAEVVKTLAACLQEDFVSESVRIISLSPIADLVAEWYVCMQASDVRLLPFSDCLANGEPICGRLNAEKTQILFGDDAHATQSIALIPISDIGLVAIGSADSHRFYPGMGTLFLRWISELYQVAVLRCRR